MHCTRKVDQVDTATYARLTPGTGTPPPNSRLQSCTAQLTAHTLGCSNILYTTLRLVYAKPVLQEARARQGTHPIKSQGCESHTSAPTSHTLCSWQRSVSGQMQPQHQTPPKSGDQTCLGGLHTKKTCTNHVFRGSATSTPTA